MASILDQIAAALEATLNEFAEGPPDGFSMACLVNVDRLPEYSKEDLQAKPVVTIIPKGHERRRRGRGGWEAAPDVGVLIQFGLPDRKEPTEALRKAAEDELLEQLGEFADQVERIVANSVVLDRRVETLTQTNGAFYFAHLKDKRIFSRFLAVTYTAQLI